MVDPISASMDAGLALGLAAGLALVAAVVAALVVRLALERRHAAEVAALRAQLHAQELAQAEQQARQAAERQASAEKLALLQDAREQLVAQFRQLAGDILEDKSRRFGEQNRVAIDALLAPVRERLQAFQAKVEDVHLNDTRERSALAEQVRQLLELNRQLSDDAQNLTQALKGSSKTQGAWGELMLERLLEASGLRRGEEFEVQVAMPRDDGSRGQPDVVVKLPEDRYLVIDAKVSLVAWADYVAAADDAARAAALARHRASVRQHMRGLSERDYPALFGGRAQDFTLMFVPIEPAFLLAIADDAQLFADAWQRNVLLVSPSTLLFSLRTVAHLWRQEAQRTNAQEIAQRGAALYDRLVAFAEEFERVGERLDQARHGFDEARAKLATRKGNVIRQAAMLRELGVKPAKLLPEGLRNLDEAHADADSDAP
jgi:DNA recombination protein RmuC